MQKPDKLPNQLFPFFFHFLKAFRFPAIIYLFVSFLTGFVQPIGSVMLKMLIDRLNGHPQEVFSSLTWVFAVLYLVNFEVHNLCWRTLTYICYKYRPQWRNQIVQDTFTYVQSHSHRFFQENLSGKIAHRLSTLVENMEEIVSNFLPQAIRGVVLVVIALIGMYFVHPLFCGILVAWFGIFVLISLPMVSQLSARSSTLAAKDAQVSGEIVDSITNAYSMRIFARRGYETNYLKESLGKENQAYRKKVGLTLVMNFFQGLSITAMIGVMLYYLLKLYAVQEITIGDFALILTLSLDVGYMTWWWVFQVEQANVAVGKCQQAVLALMQPIEIVDAPKAKELKVSKGEISFERVSFAYHKDDWLFREESVTIHPGQKVGLVGYSGGGKTSFVHLLLRLYEINKGHILIDGQDISQVTTDSLRENIGMIPQDPSLFHRSLMENIRYGKVDATDSEVIEAAKKAHVDAFVQKIPEKYEALVGERGIKLSGGQRQRIAIARAILKDAPILILDEATSQLDSVTEADIQESLKDLMVHKTTLVIAHRLSTLLAMDRILVFDQGKIVEDGTHATLLQKGGIYRSLWDAQVGGFLPDQIDKET